MERQFEQRKKLGRRTVGAADVRVLDAAKLRVTNGRNDKEHHV